MTDAEHEAALAAVRTKILDLAVRIDVPTPLLPKRDGVGADEGSLWVDLNRYPGDDDDPVDDEGKRWLFELKLKDGGEWTLTECIDPAYLVQSYFMHATSVMATARARQTPRPSEDPRRQQFALQVDLLRKIDPAWAEYRARQQAGILSSSPFKDQR